MTRTFLGTGWNFPVRTDSRSTIVAAADETDIEQSIRIILGTAKGERVMRPDFGCDIHDYAFAVVDTTTRTLISSSVEEALARWEPRIDVERVDTSTADLDAGRLLVEIAYRIRSSNARRNLVYPFYLEE
ncbi:GPW/gp25 family protein [Halogeometricum pallidum JCM 14848]|uniref:GPW/gp25 family protein n=1 Tax=Halogeometricum pallidum JCM 14848 TaxID=1227487 RepID=M0DEF1_HALPD|nr:GPW/gp25 family protein [Halogeometricum pallidum]ELZ32514.1 GPW/gp25 family protein [Halogeometricum pallidum JCM 14848]